MLVFCFLVVNESEDKQLLEPRNRHPICFVGPFWAARLSSWFIPSGSRFHAATQDVRSCSTLADLYSEFDHVGFWSLDEFEHLFLWILWLFANAQGFRSRVEFMDFVDWKLPLTCAYTIKSRIWLSHPSASSGVRGSVSSSSCTPHSACKIFTERCVACCPNLIASPWSCTTCNLCWRSVFWWWTSLKTSSC